MSIMKRLIPSSRALIAFDAAARHQSFSKAADELALTQSAVCRQIAGLEELLGVALFHRSKRGVTLTDAGQTYSRQMAARLDAVERDTLQLMAQRGGGALELAVVPTFASRWLIPRLAAFQQAHPDITVNMTTRTRHFLFEETEFDAAIYAGAPDWPGAEAQYLLREEVIAVCSPALIAPRQALRPEEILAYPLLQQTTRPYAWRAWFDACGVDKSQDGGNAMYGPRYELFSMLAQAASCRQGIALIPRLLIEEELATGRLICAVPELAMSDRAYYLAYPGHKAESGALKSFRAWLAQETAAYGENSKESGAGNG